MGVRRTQMRISAPTALSEGLGLSHIPTGQNQLQHQGPQYYHLQSHQQKKKII